MYLYRRQNSTCTLSHLAALTSKPAHAFFLPFSPHAASHSTIYLKHNVQRIAFTHTAIAKRTACKPAIPVNDSHRS